MTCTLRSHRLAYFTPFCGVLVVLFASRVHADFVVTDLYTLTGPPTTTVFQNNYPYIHGTASGGQVTGASSQLQGQALLWNQSGTPTNLTPTSLGFNYGYVWATNGTQQVGAASIPAAPPYDEHAILWNNTAASAIDLNAPGYQYSRAFGLSGNQQVGYGYASGFADNHAMLWNSTAASMTDLHPASGYSSSVALGTDGTHQVGGARVQGIIEDHAVLWTGSAQSFVDLNPIAGGTSGALAIAGDQIVGDAQPPGSNSHAALWSVSTHAFTDLTPSPASGPDNFQAFGLDTNGTQQVGWIQDSNGIRAQLWSGSAQSVVNLQSSLPNTFTGSFATSIDGQGNIFGIGIDSNNNFHAIEWSPTAIPEPASAAILLLAGTTLALRRHRPPSDSKPCGRSRQTHAPPAFAEAGTSR